MSNYPLITSCLLFIFCCVRLKVSAQNDVNKNSSDSVQSKSMDYFRHQKDLVDLTYSLLHKNPETRLENSDKKSTGLYFTVAPIIEYTTATGFSPGIAGNVAFMTSVTQPTNNSSLLGAIKYTQKNQFLLPIQSSIWTPGNKYNYLGDWRYLKYPQDTYGFGGYTTLTDKYIINYKYLRLYEFVLRRVTNNFYAGLGYQLDYHWGISELDVLPGHVTDYEKYGFTKTSTSSGVALDILYDTRKNSISPKGGEFFANVKFVQNATLLGANNNWNSLTIDLRKYFKMPFNTILAFWYYNVFTLSGNPPYLDLTGSGSDTYNNTGRGYEQGRFTGKNMIDVEAELRFNITRNGLLGGVIFSSAESVSELGSNKFEVLLPAVGIGLRIKLNKFSSTSACIDYGIGTKGSRGFAGNLGEVF